MEIDYAIRMWNWPILHSLKKPLGMMVTWFKVLSNHKGVRQTEYGFLYKIVFYCYGNNWQGLSAYSCYDIMISNVISCCLLDGV